MKGSSESYFSFLFRATNKLAMLVVVAEVFGILLVPSPSETVVIGASIIWGFLLLLFSILDSFWRIGPRRTVIFMALSCGLSFIAEYLGSKYGWFFGSYAYHTSVVSGNYFYHILILDQVSSGSILGWWIVMYLSFFTTNNLAGNHRQRPKSSSTGGMTGSIFRLLTMASIDGLIATSLDLSIEPVATEYFGLWEWLDLNNGGFGGAPLSNYVHWFLLAMVISLIFRAYMLTSHSSLPMQIESKIRFWPEYATPVIYFLLQSWVAVIIIQKTSYSGYGFMLSSFVATTLLLMAVLLFRERKRRFSPQSVRRELATQQITKEIH